jgi:hypothetical protein
MMTMLSPDLLDRRALGAIRLLDPTGSALVSKARISGAGLKIFAKDSGIHLILGAPGLVAHQSTFDTPPGAPALGSKRYAIDVLPDDRRIMPRRAEIRLPRNPDPANARSLFTPIDIAMAASADAIIPATSAAVRVVVTQQGDGRRVGGALVRVSSDNGQFSGTGVTNPAGEALVVIPRFPMTHAGGNAALTDDLAGHANVVADPATVLLAAEAELMSARFDALPDPDALAEAFPDPGGGVALRLSVRKPAFVSLQWAAP